MHARVGGYLCLESGATALIFVTGLAGLTGCAPSRDELSAQNAPGSGAGLQLTAADAAAADESAAESNGDRFSFETVALAAQSGYYATDGRTGALRGADLGWTFKHHDKLWIMYGDSWWLDPLNLQGRPDDALGQISLSDFPDAASVEAFVAAHPAPQGQPAWRAAAPTMQVFTKQSGGFDPVISQSGDRQLYGGLGGVPIAAFSNGRTGSAEGVFAVFFNYEQVTCDEGRCADGRECDTGLGLARSRGLSAPCVVGTGSSCMAGPGLCQDRRINRYDASTSKGRTSAVPLWHAVGVTTSANPTHFETQPWATLRFYNSTARTVSDFDAARAAGAGNDYTPAEGDSLPRSGVLLWGRPDFGGALASGRDARLYLAWAPMPVPDAEGHFDWKPRYFSGLDAEQRPLFVEHEVEAKALDLDATSAGDQPEEAHDIVGQMNITWVPALKRFVMFYGGDSSGFAENLLQRVFEPEPIQLNPEGSLYVRFAAQPWGPWSAPQQLMAAGNRAHDAEPVGQYAEGGVLAHNKCRSEQCARFDPAYTLDIGNNNNGVLYGPSFIDAWTATNGDATSLYWLLSTWNPYQTVLMRTTLRPE